jgi:hypothetical protein
MACRRRQTVDVASPHTSPVTVLYGCSKNARNTATLCHFSAAPARRSGTVAGSVSRCRVTRWDLVCGPPGGPKAEWHRFTGKCHREDELMLTPGMGSPALAAPRSRTIVRRWTRDPRRGRAIQGPGSGFALGDGATQWFHLGFDDSMIEGASSCSAHTAVSTLPRACVRESCFRIRQEERRPCSRT